MAVQRKLKNIEAVKRIENVDPAVSDQYVPIYTSKIVEHLQPECQFIVGWKFFPKLSAHNVVLSYKDETIIITNSYDRSRAFSMLIGKNHFYVPVKLDRVIHRGQGAEEVAEEFINNKKALFEGIENAKKIVNYFKDTKITEKTKKEIFNIVFKRQIDQGKKIIITIGDSYNTIQKYIDTIVERYFEGDYYTENPKNGKIRKGRKIKSRFNQLYVTNKIVKYIEQNHPEIFI